MILMFYALQNAKLCAEHFRGLIPLSSHMDSMITRCTAAELHHRTVPTHRDLNLGHERAECALSPTISSH